MSTITSPSDGSWVLTCGISSSNKKFYRNEGKNRLLNCRKKAQTKKLLSWDLRTLNSLNTVLLKSTSSHQNILCNTWDTGSIPGSGRSAGEGLVYPLQYSWASLMAQLIKNPPAMQETWVRSLEKRKATHSSILAWRIPQTV